MHNVQNCELYGILHSHRRENLKSYIICRVLNKRQDDGYVQNSDSYINIPMSQTCLILL
jgi:hypothetical protein